MGKGEDRLRGFQVVVRLEIAPAKVSKKERERLAALVEKAVADNIEVKEWFRLVGKGLGIALKAALMSTLLAFCIGCGAAPPDVLAAQDASALALHGFIANTDKIEAQWRAAFRAEAMKRLLENRADALDENTDKDGKILTKKAVELFGLLETKQVEMEVTLEKARLQYVRAREEALTAAHLNASISSWLRRSVLQPTDFEALLGLAEQLAAQARAKGP